MLLKYSVELQKLNSVTSPCPATNANSIVTSFEAYRLVNNPASAEDFLPPAKKNLGRESAGGRSATCSSFALSYFDTFENAQKKYCQLVALKGAPLQDIGDHIALSKILPTDGISTLPSKRSGHFDLYEQSNAQLELSSNVISKANCG